MLDVKDMSCVSSLLLSACLKEEEKYMQRVSFLAFWLLSRFHEAVVRHYMCTLQYCTNCISYHGLCRN